MAFGLPSKRDMRFTKKKVLAATVAALVVGLIVIVGVGVGVVKLARRP